jgi:hypothetical protein
MRHRYIFADSRIFNIDTHCSDKLKCWRMARQFI